MCLFKFIDRKAVGKAVTRAGAALGDKIDVSKKNTYSNKYEFNGNDEHCRLIIS